MKTVLRITLLSLVLIALGCSKDDNEVPVVQVEPEVEDPVKSSEKELISFTFRKADNGIPDNFLGAIDSDKNTVTIVTTANAGLESLLPQLEISERASYTPQGIQDFSEPVIYTITAEDGTENTYTIDVKTERDLLIAITEANPNNTLDWNFAETDLEDWRGVGLNDQGYIIELSIEGDNLVVLPEEIGFFSKLQDLDLEDNQIEALPKTVGHLINLIELDLDENNLRELPSEFAQLTALNVLNLNDNLFEEFPKEVFELSNLVELYYSNMQLKELPQELGNLFNLEELELYNNLLSDLPSDMQFLTKLRRVALSQNQFTKIPEVLFTLYVLENLGLDDNMIQEIPQEITNLSSLRGLFLNNNQLNSLPSELASIESLSSLEIRGNSIEFLPEEICARTDIGIIKDDTTVCKE